MAGDRLRALRPRAPLGSLQRLNLGLSLLNILATFTSSPVPGRAWGRAGNKLRVDSIPPASRAQPPPQEKESQADLYSRPGQQKGSVLSSKITINYRINHSGNCQGAERRAERETAAHLGQSPARGRVGHNPGSGLGREGRGRSQAAV